MYGRGSGNSRALNQWEQDYLLNRLFDMCSKDVVVSTTGQLRLVHRREHNERAKRSRKFHR